MSNISITALYKELEEMTDAEREALLTAPNPLKKLAEKKRNEAWDKIRAYVDERIKHYEREYKEDWGTNYVETMRDDKISSTICQTAEFDKLIDDYFELSI